MDQGLIATIGAIVGGTIPLGALTFTLIRWIDEGALLINRTAVAESREGAA